MSGRRPVFRNLLIVLVLFSFAGAGIVVAHFRRPYASYEEPPELVAKRLDHENNAYYAFLEAAARLPQDLLPLAVKDETGLERVYEPLPGSVGEMLRILRPDDDPLLIEYVAKAAPAVELAWKAAEKPWFLFPPVDWSNKTDNTLEKDALESIGPLRRLEFLLFLDAASMECSPEPTQDACARMRRACELTWRMNADRYGGNFSVPVPLVATVIRKAAPDHQRQILAWLAEARRAWDPSLRSLSFSMQFLYECQPNVPEIREVYRKVEKWASHTRQKQYVRRRESLYCEAAKLTFQQFQLQKPRFAAIESPPQGPFNLCLHGESINRNSRFFATVDGLSVAVALELYRRDHGSCPESLAPLAPDYLPELPKSPYDGQDFDYRREGDDYILHCRTKLVQYYAGVTRSARMLIHGPAHLDKDYWRQQPP